MLSNSQSFGGFDPKIFLKPVNMDFICSSVVRQPKECTVCGTLFCSDCLKQWEEKNRKSILYP